MLKKRMNTITASFLIMLMIVMLLPFSNVYADTIEYDHHQFKVVAINFNTVKIEENDTVEILSVVRNPDGTIREVNIKNNNGQSEQFLIDPKAHTIYSSATNQIITIDAEPFSPQLQAVGDLHTYKFSFAKIRSVSQDVNTLSKLAKVLLVLIGALGVVCTSPLATIVGIIGGVAGIVNFVSGHQSDTGIYIVLKETTRRVRKDGRIFYVKDNIFYDCGTY